ncbi:MAG: superoxide dismutase family protein [Acidimicrobiia bacterium]|nr:superoxide dismutase family protein [Acidimicrobiia bacterium]
MTITTHRIRTAAAVTAAVGVLAVAAIGMTTVVGASGDAVHGQATIVDLAGEPIGFAKLVEDGDGSVHINVKVSGLSAGLHGTHIHELGSCDPFSSAGSHHRALGTDHPDHYGDLPNLVVNGAGRGHLEATTDRATLSAGAATIFDANGSAIVVHALEDQFDTTNFGGARVACGVIVPD